MVCHTPSKHESIPGGSSGALMSSTTCSTYLMAAACAMLLQDAQKRRIWGISWRSTGTKLFRVDKCLIRNVSLYW